MANIQKVYALNKLNLTPTHFAEFIKALNPIFKKFGVSKFNDGQNISIFFTPIFLFNRYKLLSSRRSKSPFY